jgi:protease-4
MLQTMVDEVFQKFKSAVSEGRAYSAEVNSKNPQGEKGRRLANSWEDLADGRVLTGTAAFENGFVDELGNFDQAFQRARKLSGISEATLVEYKQHYDFSDFFRLFGSSEARTIKVDVGVEVPRLRAGQLYFLSSTFAQ